MAYTKHEFMEMAKRHADRNASALIAESQMFRRAAVDAAALTGIPEWDNFCTYAQGWISELERDVAARRKALENETLIDPVEIAALRQAIICSNIRIDCFKKMMAFPRDAQAMLAELQEKTDG